MNAHVLNILDALAINEQQCVANIVFESTQGITRYTQQALFAQARQLTTKLRNSGISPRDRIGIAAKSSFQWMVFDLACILLDCVSYCFPVELLSEKKPQQLAHEYQLQLLFVEEEHYGAEMPLYVVPLKYWETASWQLLYYSATVQQALVVLPEDVFTVVFSSGTSGKLKSLLISKIGTAHLIKTLADKFALTRKDTALTFLPFSIFQQRWIYFLALYRQSDFVFCDPFRVMRGLKEHKPTILAAPPMFYESIYDQFLKLPIMQRRALQWAAEGVNRFIHLDGLRRRLLKKSFNPFYAGLSGKIRLMMVGGAPSKQSMLDFFVAIGLPLREGYGLTETGYLTINTLSEYREGSVGKPLYPGLIDIGEGGEIFAVLEKPLCLGYLNDVEETEKTFITPHRIATGDIGHLDEEGYLHLTGRKKEIIITSAGYKVHPEVLEKKIEINEWVKTAVVLGGEEFADLRAVISLQEDCQAARGSVKEIIKKINKSHPNALRINHVVFTDKNFSVESGLRNRNLKINRRAVKNTFYKELAG